MATEDAPPRSLTPEYSVMSYEVATTSIIYGLPPHEQGQILQRYRGLYRGQAARYPQSDSDHGSPTFHALNMMYDLACQYLKNMHAVDVQDTQADSDSDEDSIFSNDDPPPPLLPLSSSSGEASLVASSPGTDLPTTPLGTANASAEVHGLRIIGVHGTRDVQCDCTNRLHSVYARRDVFAFCDHEGNVVIKKLKTVLLPLN
ncbi:hypothetical protein GGX14DRAFT_573835 [Mycena pura]|uniref:Uncharacterized protein n=1 Tax=Mycena pura TaxID=153505 RepID=A0AAD6V5T1_9AGAR|nr:hypothetical protein GGX14DRAFT_573835 [Mycena pura]